MRDVFVDGLDANQVEPFLRAFRATIPSDCVVRVRSKTPVPVTVQRGMNRALLDKVFGPNVSVSLSPRLFREARSSKGRRPRGAQTPQGRQ
jgi:hypothetical protein